MTDQEIIKKVLATGKTYVPAYVPEELPKGEPGDCFDTCLMAACKFPELNYVEGVARNPLTGKWVLHAWLTDGEAAIDLTWRIVDNVTKEIKPIPTEYVGIEMNTRAVAGFVRATGYKCVLVNYWRNKEKSYPLIQKIYADSSPKVQKVC